MLVGGGTTRPKILVFVFCVVHADNFHVLPWGSGVALVSLKTGIFAGFGPGLAHLCWWVVVPPDPKSGFLSFVWCTLTIFVGDASQVLEWMSVVTLVQLKIGAFPCFGPRLAHLCWWMVLPPDPKPSLWSFVWCLWTDFISDAHKVLEWVLVVSLSLLKTDLLAFGGPGLEQCWWVVVPPNPTFLVFSVVHSDNFHEWCISSVATSVSGDFGFVDFTGESSPQTPNKRPK